jgi:Ser/Thr protein kinase RdoA (MazF antagonist)
LNIISGLENDREVFGLIHGDINIGNFFLDRDKITIFDFDECQYSWFIEDIAIQLYYAVYVILDDTIDEREEMAKKFMDKFMEGYRIENSIDDDWLNILPLFLRLREIIVHDGMYRSWDLKDLNQWQRDYIEQSRYRIEKGIPLVNL